MTRKELLKWDTHFDWHEITPPPLPSKYQLGFSEEGRNTYSEYQFGTRPQVFFSPSPRSLDKQEVHLPPLSSASRGHLGGVEGDDSEEDGGGGRGRGQIMNSISAE